ncbi:MAG: hypothetical protein GOU98_04810 [Candidatus Altiarchaeota archaeon]|nr:hypothetical protein [Candidatus Altiarchaeota archaeon]
MGEKLNQYKENLNQYKDSFNSKLSSSKDWFTSKTKPVTDKLSQYKDTLKGHINGEVIKKVGEHPSFVVSDKEAKKMLDKLSLKPEQYFPMDKDVITNLSDTLHEYRVGVDNLKENIPGIVDNVYSSLKDVRDDVGKKVLGILDDKNYGFTGVSSLYGLGSAELKA